MTNNNLASLALLSAGLGLAGCNAPAAHSQANFNAAGQALGHGNVGAGASYTGHAFADGAQATGQAITSAFHGNSGQ